MSRQLTGLVLGSIVAIGLAGCQETTTAARQRIDAPGVPVSVQSISGAPDSVTAQFTSLLGAAAAERQMEIVPGDKPARFRVRGYLTAQPTADGQTALAFVWDVYDASKRRAQRVQGESLGRRGGGGDPWAGIDQTIVARAASDSMDAIATFLVANPVDETAVVSGEKTAPDTSGKPVAADKTRTAAASTDGSL